MSRAFLLPLLALVLTMSGCAADEPSSTASKTPRAAQGQRSTPAPTQTPAPPAESAPSAAPDQGQNKGQGQDQGRSGRDRTGSRGKNAPLLPLRRVALDQHLLPEARMPGMGADVSWKMTGEGPEDTRRAGSCQKTSLGSIGAVSAVRRTFAVSAADRSTPAPVAFQVVARFADDKSAWRAHLVLAAWHEDCAERLEHARREVGPMRPVEGVQVGTGANYLAEYGPKAPNQGWAAGFGIVRMGSHLSVVEIRTGSTDYPSRRDPARVAVRRIARTFG